MKMLHLIRNIKDTLAKDVIKSASNGTDNTIVLIQDAVYEDLSTGSFKILTCEEDLKARQIESPYQKVSYDELARLVIEYDRVIVW